MDTGKVGFAVIYRWRVSPEREAAFIAAWQRITELVIERRGGLGSRLHRAADGTFVAYAQWPSEDAWRAAGERRDVLDDAAVSSMREAIVERFDELRLTPLADLLLPARDDGA